MWADGRSDRRTDKTKLIVAFRNTANAPKNDDHVRRVERFAVNLGEGKTVTMLMMVIRVHGAREGVGQPLLVIDLLQFYIYSSTWFRSYYRRGPHARSTNVYSSRYTPSVICPNPSICFRQDTTLHFDYTVLLCLTLCSPDTDKPTFIHNLKHHSQKSNCFKSSHINVLKKAVNTFPTYLLSRTYFRTPKTSFSIFFFALPSR
jgi:hypothetical protein